MEGIFTIRKSDGASESKSLWQWRSLDLKNTTTHNLKLSNLTKINATKNNHIANTQNPRKNPIFKLK